MGRKRNIRCGKNIKDDKEFMNSAISNNPTIAQLKAKVDNYKQRIAENKFILKKEKNKETKKVIKNENGKVMKPEGWQPPQLDKYV